MFGIYIQYKLTCAPSRNNSRCMLPIYGLVALTMLKPVHCVFRSYDVFTENQRQPCYF